ncbi:VanZ family protein [Sporolactobacillus sp. THM7-4]|nr:VanZ family protein [Sporolactobacillus sp. THM7-4]
MREIKPLLRNTLLVLSILFVLYFTMIPNEYIGTGQVTSSTHRYNLNPWLMFETMPSSTLFYFIVDNIGNIILFVPFGFFLPIKFPKLKLVNVSACGALLSASVEIIQLFVPNRMTDIDDVILNVSVK